MRPERSRSRSVGHPGKVLIAARDAVMTFLFPDRCVACGTPLDASRRHLCSVCESGLLARDGSLALPALGGAPGCPRTGGRAFYALEFEGVTRAMVHALKYDGRTSLAATLAAIAVPAALSACDAPPDIVTPVPLHPLRLRERGFNQSDLLAARLASGMNVPVRTTLVRVRSTPPQARLPRRERLAMPPSAFRAPAGGADLGRVLLVDDVVTTGATLAAASLALLGAGAAEVICFALAGTPSRAPAGRTSPKAVDCAVGEH
ncbi:MAG: phosphoribosyltransferase family protein [Candidatus Eisenbacteria bacterium]